MLSFIKYGSGPVVWLAFHGIGQDATAFAPFGERLAETHTIYSLNLPFHGPDWEATGWPDVITKPYWQRLLTDFLAQHQIDRFSVAGFSMGGRFALVTSDLFAHRLDELILIAPDGITEDRWFRLATGTWAGRALLRFFLNHTQAFHRVGLVLVELKLLNPALLRFAEATMKTPRQRTQIYHAWTGFRMLTINVPTLAQQLIDENVTTFLVLGQYDAVLPFAHTQPLVKALPNCRVRVLPTGHTSLVRKVAENWH